MTFTELMAHDPSDMFSAISGFSEQVQRGIELGREAAAIELPGIRRVLVLGMGGSAIGGDLLRSYVSAFEDHAGVDVVVSRGYRPPPADGSTLVVASSYSGNTEETIEAYEREHGRAGAVLVLTTGGKLAELAARDGYPVIMPPSGLQPRAALGYGFFPLVYALAVRSELFGATVRDETLRGLDEAPMLLSVLSAEFGSGATELNVAHEIASTIKGHIPVIYSAGQVFDSVNLRWRGQIQENAKHLAFGNLLPEMNHNEINGWLQPDDLVGRCVAVFLRDAGDHPRVARRLDITEEILGRHVATTVRAESRGESLLARMFSLVHLGDWVSYWLAVLNGVDPTPVPVIEDLKKELSA